MKKKPFNENLIFLLIPVIIISMVLIFLFNKDGGISGGKALALEGFWFWFFVVVGIAVAAGCAYFAYKNEAKAGKNIYTFGAIAFGAIVLFSVFAKACTDKANGGVTAPKHQVSVESMGDKNTINVAIISN
jgi:surface polysaccharide O-acyltransferase-like enzyme